jgi:hypothetical protein
MRTTIGIAIAFVAAQAALGATYTWTGAGDGVSWEDPRNWGQTQNYPSSTSYIAKFTSDASVTLGADTTIYSIDIAAGASVTLAAAGESVPKLTLNNAMTWNGGLALDSVFVYRNGDLTPGAAASLSLANGAQFQCNTLKLLSGQPFSLAGGSWASVNELHVNSPSTTVTIDDSTLLVRSHFYCGSTTTPGGGRIVFKGAAPLLDVRGSNFRTSANAAAWTAGFDYDFDIPLGGYAAPPIQATAAKLFDSMGSTTHQNRFNVLASSPALTAGTRLTTVLVHAPVGIVRDRAEGSSASAPVSFAAMDGAAATSDATAQHLVMTLNPAAAEAQTPAAVTTAQLSPLAPTGAASRRTITATYQVTALANDGTTTRATLEGGAVNDTATFTDGTSAILTTPGKYSNLTWTAPRGVFQTCYLRVRVDQLDGGGNVVATVYSDVFTTATLDNSTYTWQPVEGDWDGAVNVRAHWACDADDDDRLDWPSHNSSKAVVPAGATATISIPSALSSGTWTFSADSATTFVSAAPGATPLLTAVGATFTAGSAVTLDHAAVKFNGNQTISARSSLTALNGSALTCGNFYLNSSGGQALLSVCGGSTMTVGHIYLGYGNRIVIDDGSITMSGTFYAGSGGANGSVLFRGANPRLHLSAVKQKFGANMNNSVVDLNFLIPAGGYAETPITGASGMNNTFGTPASGNGTIRFNVLDESPAAFADATLAQDLVEWSKGFATSYLTQGNLPAGTTGAAYAVGATTYSVSFTGAAGRCLITAEPEERGAPSPAYGAVSGLSAGASRTFTSPAYTNATTGFACTATGWRLYAYDPATLDYTDFLDDGTGDTCAYTHPTPSRATKLVWNLDIAYLVRAAASAGGSVAPASQWVRRGTSCSVLATADAGDAFLRWTGDAVGTRERLDIPSVMAPMSVTASFGGAIHVAVNGNDSTADGTAEHPYATLASAINAAADGDAIVVGPGDYAPAATVSVTKGVTVRGATGAPEDVRISGSDSRQVMIINHPNAIVRDLTLEYGFLNQGAGAGVKIDANGGTIDHCIVRNIRTTLGTQGAVYLGSDDAYCFNCVLTNYIGSEYGGGSRPGGILTVNKGKAANCFISGATASTRTAFWGAGIRIDGGVVANCTVTRNFSPHDGGIYLAGGRAVNCLIWENRSDGCDTTGYDVAFPGGTGTANGVPIGIYNAARLSVLDHCVARYAPNDTCIAAGDVPATGDYMTPLPGSPVLDVGVEDDLDWIPPIDLNGNPRRVGAAIDAGCCEYQGAAPAIAFTAVPHKGLLPLEVTFTASVEGAVPGDYVWDFGDGTAPVTTSSPSVTHTYTAEGVFSPSVTCGTLTWTSTDRVTARPATVNVTTAAGLRAALDTALAGQEIVLAPGEYGMDALCNVTAAVTVRGATGNPDDVIVKTAAKGYPLLRVNDPAARIESLTLDGANLLSGGNGLMQVHFWGGSVSNCVIRNGYKSGRGHANAEFLGPDSHISHCVISNNVSTADSQGGFNSSALSLQWNATARECLVTDNRMSGSSAQNYKHAAGAVLGSSALLENCTIVNNTGDTTGGVRIDSGTARNCVVANNRSTASGTAYDNIYPDTESKFSSCVIVADASSGYFADYAAGDFRPAAGSPLIDAGAARDDAPATDLAGADRVMGSSIDIGAYEFNPDTLGVSLVASLTQGFAPAEVTFSAVVSGTNGTDALRFEWTVNGVPAGTTSESRLTRTFQDCGLVGVTVRVTNLASGVSVSDEKPELVYLVPRVLHVVHGNPDAAFPYDTLANAASNVYDAVDAAIAGCTVELAPGIHTNTLTLLVDKDVVVRGGGATPAETVMFVQGTARTDKRSFELNSPGAVFENLTLKPKGSSATYNYVAVLLGASGGMVTNCIVTGEGFEMMIQNNGDLGVVTHTVITNCEVSTYSGGGSWKALVGDFSGAGRWSNLLIARNRFNASELFPVVWLRGEMDHCTIVSNNLVRNGAIDLDSNEGARGRGVYFRHIRTLADTSAVRGCIFAGNMTNGVPCLLAGGPGTFSDCLGDHPAGPYTSLGADALVAPAASVFKNPSAGDWHLRSTSPAINRIRRADAGDMPAIDLGGNPRLFGSRYDLGCFEFQQSGAMYLLLK